MVSLHVVPVPVVQVSAVLTPLSKTVNTPDEELTPPVVQCTKRFFATPALEARAIGRDTLVPVQEGAVRVLLRTIVLDAVAVPGATKFICLNASVCRNAGA